MISGGRKRTIPYEAIRGGFSEEKLETGMDWI